MRLKEIADIWTDEVIWEGGGSWAERSQGATVPRRPLLEGDVVVVRVGGRVIRYHEGMSPTLLPRNFIVVRLKPSARDRYDQDFMAAHIAREFKGLGSARGRELLRGTAQQATTVSRVGDLTVTGDASIEQQQQWAATIAALAAAERSHRRLEEKQAMLKQGLEMDMPRLRLQTDSQRMAAIRSRGAATQRMFVGDPFYLRWTGAHRNNADDAAAFIRSRDGGNSKARVVRTAWGWAVYAGGQRVRRVRGTMA